MIEDAALLRRYAAEKSEEAFAELVRRRVGLVYSVALRQVGGDAHLAEDVTQRVFADLARKAAALSERAVLSGWLYRSAQFAASDLVRAERRRRAREEETKIMNEPFAAEAAVDWEKVRPVLDETLGELADEDRDAVALRFFENRPFAEIGSALNISEDTARKRVDRALDKLHALLARRGVTSTTAALGLALAGQAGAAAPVGLAAAVTNAAIVDGATGIGAVKVLTFMTTTKAITCAAGIVAVVAVGVAVYKTGQANRAAAALISANQERATLAARLAAAEEREQRSRKRADEAEKDSGELLKAVEAFRAQQSAPSAASSGAGSPFNAQAQLAYERQYQQDLARRRAEDAKFRARIDDEVRSLSPAQKFGRLSQAAEEYFAKGDFSAATRMLNHAMESKPADFTLPDEVTRLKTALSEQTEPVTVTLQSDGKTFMIIADYRVVGVIGGYTMVQIPPGDYQVIGRRLGFQDVLVPIRVRSGLVPPTITVSCAVSDRK